MATFNKELRNVTISLEDQINPDDELLTVSFNQCPENEKASFGMLQVSEKSGISNYLFNLHDVNSPNYFR